jgi:hypothetical protein
MPPLLYDIIRVFLLLSGPAAFICLILAGIALRREGGTVFWVGGGFSKHMLWAVIFLALEPTLGWFQFLGIPVFFPPAATIGTPWLASIQQGITTFVQSFVVDRLPLGRTKADSALAGDGPEHQISQSRSGGLSRFFQAGGEQWRGLANMTASCTNGRMEKSGGCATATGMANAA